jgi:hypothetical protein
MVLRGDFLDKYLAIPEISEVFKKNCEDSTSLGAKAENIKIIRET